MVLKNGNNPSLLIILAIFGFILLSAYPSLFLLLLVGGVIWYAYKKGSLPASDIMSMVGKVSKYFSVILVGASVLFLVKRALIIIPSGKVGVVEVFGKVYDQELGSGLNFKNPLSKVILMDTRTQDYTMSIAYNEGRKAQSDVITALTKEGLSVGLDVTVLYHLKPESASDLYKNVGLDYDEKIIRPSIRSSIREVIAWYDAKDIYSEKRTEATRNISDLLGKAITQRGIELEEVLLRDVQLPKKLTESIEEKLTADQDAQRMNFVLQKEEKEAERKRIEAEGQRDSQKIIDESLTSKYLEYLYINSLKDRQGTIYVPINPQTGLPVFKSIP